MRLVEQLSRAWSQRSRAWRSGLRGDGIEVRDIESQQMVLRVDQGRA